ncbi:MAG: ATP-binding protein, partial [Deltaproteobacteria bacterium]
AFCRGESLQVAITDEGPGIDFRTLPRATLVPGFSTAASLGMGFTIMLQLCERVLLSTRPGRTVVVLEIAAARDQSVRGPAPADGSGLTSRSAATSESGVSPNVA